MWSRPRAIVLFVAVVALFVPAVPADADTPLVTIDPGHGGPYPGAMNCNYSFAGKSCLQESDANLDISLRARAILDASGLRTRMTRTKDARANEPPKDIETWNPEEDGSRSFYKDGEVNVRDDLQARVNLANCAKVHETCDAGSAEADAFVSVHNNCCSSTGTETYYDRHSAEGRILATRLQEEVVAHGGRADRGTRPAGFYVTRYTRMPAALVEGVYVNDDEEARLLLDAGFRQRLAQGIAKGTIRYVGFREILDKGIDLRESGMHTGDRRTDEIEVPGGWRVDYDRVAIYWSPRTGAHVAYGAIHEKYLNLGGSGVFGLPVTDEHGVPGGRASDFQKANATVYWSPRTGAHVAYGAIHEKYREFGGPGGFMGFPTTDEIDAGRGQGRVSVFQRARVYWSSMTGAHEVHGAILARYLREGGARGVLGFPVTDEYSISGGARSDFQRGSIEWDRRTGETRVVIP